MFVLGISGGYHDAAAALTCAGTIVGAVQEERFSRTKNDAGFPYHSIEWCLAPGGATEAGVDPSELSAAVWYEKPVTKFTRVLRSLAAAGPRALPTAVRGMPLVLTVVLVDGAQVAIRLTPKCGCRGKNRPEGRCTSSHPAPARSRA